MFIDCSKAMGSGLKLRPLNDTIKEVLTWRETNHASEQMEAGIDRDKEQSLLRKWHQVQ